MGVYIVGETGFVNNNVKLSGNKKQSRSRRREFQY